MHTGALCSFTNGKYVIYWFLHISLCACSSQWEREASSAAIGHTVQDREGDRCRGEAITRMILCMSLPAAVESRQVGRGGETSFQLLQKATQGIVPVPTPLSHRSPLPVLPTSDSPCCSAPLYAQALYRRTGGTPLSVALVVKVNESNSCIHNSLKGSC